MSLFRGEKGVTNLITPPFSTFILKSSLAKHEGLFSPTPNSGLDEPHW
jgi:hypothetical protein